MTTKRSRSIPRLTLATVLCLFLFTFVSEARAARVHVIIYHTFLGKERIKTDFSVEELREHVGSLKKNGFRFVSYADIAEGSVSGNKNILLCIDDGNRSVYRAYTEVLRPEGIKPLLAIYPNIIGRKHYALRWKQLRGLVREGCEIAAHGFFHLHVNEKLYKKNKRYFLDEIHKSKAVLEERLGRRISVFVYPSGEKSVLAEQEIKSAGYCYAFSIKWGTLRVPLSRNVNPLDLPRYMLMRGNWGNIFAKLERNAGKPEYADSMRNARRPSSRTNGKIISPNSGSRKRPNSLRSG